MANDLNTEIKIGADASGVEAGVSVAKRSLKDLGESAKKAGKDAADGIGSIGAGGDKAAKDVERAAKNIQGQLQRAVASFEAGEKGSRQFYESLARQRGVDVNSLKPLLDQLDAVKTKSLAAAQASTQVGSSFSSLSIAAGVAARAVAAIGIGVSVREFVTMADASTNVASRLGLVTASAAELASVQQRLFGISQASRVSFVDLAGTYAQVARSTKELGVSQNSLLGVIQTISQAVTISGGSAASAQAALTQLSQGFASGALRGEELNSILEQTPRLAQAMADGLGVGVGQLREMGKAGELTAERVLGALEKAASGVNTEFAKMAVTVEQSSTNAANSMLKLVGAFDRLLGVTSVVAGTITTISKGLDFLSRDVEKLGSQGPLRDAASEVLRLDDNARRLREGLARGILGPSAQAELERINAELALAKQRFRELDQQLSGAPSNMNEGVIASGRAREQYNAQRAKDLEAANSFRLKQSGVPEGYLKEMAELIRLNQAGVLVGKEYTDALKKQQDELLKKTGAVKSSNAAINDGINAQIEAVKRLQAVQEQIAKQTVDKVSSERKRGLATELDYINQVAEAEKKALGSAVTAAQTEYDIATKKTKNKKELAGLEGALAQAREKLHSREMAQGYAVLELQEAIDAARRKFYNDATNSSIKDLDVLVEKNKATRQEIEAIGLTGAALAQLTDARMADTIAAQEQKIASMQVFGDAEKDAYNIQLEIAKLAQMREARMLAGIKITKQAASDEWAKLYADIERGLTDSLYRGFEAGKGFFKSFWDGIKNLFKTTVLKLAVQGVMTGVGLSGTANAATGQGGAQAGDMGSSFNMGWLKDIGATAPGSLASAGASLYSQGFEGIGDSMMKIGNSLSEYSSVISGAGDVLGYAGALYSLSQGKYGSAIGAGIGTFFGGPIGAAIGSALGGLLDSDSKPSKNTGESSIKYDASGAQIERTGRFGDSSSADLAAGNLQKAYATTALALGITLAATAFGAGGNSDGETAHFGFSSAVGGRTYSTADNTVYSKEAYSLEASRAVLAALQGSELPKYLAGVFDGITAGAATQEQITAALNGAQALKSFHDQLLLMPFADLADMSFAATQGLIAAVGGLEALSGKLASYYENYYSVEEKRANTVRNITATLNAAGAGLTEAEVAGASREAFRALAESTDRNSPLYAALINVNAAFAGITPAAVDAAEAARQLADAASKAAEASRKNAMDAVDGAYAALQRSVGMQRSIVQETISSTQAVFDTLKDNVRSLYAEVDSTQAMQTTQGRAFIEQALSAAQTTGYLPDGEQLADAIGAVRAGMENTAYASQFEADRDRLVLAGRLSDLKAISGDQLTEAEKQLRALDGILDTAEAQVNALKGIDTSVLSVADALQKLADAILGVKNGAAGAAGGGAGSGAGDYMAQITPDLLKGYATDQISGANNWTFGSKEAIVSAYQAGDYASVAEIVKRAGMSQSGLQNTFGLSAADLAYINSLGIQGVDPTQAVVGHDIALGGGSAVNTGQAALEAALQQQGQAALAAGNEAGIYAEAAARGLNSGDINALLGLPPGSAEEWARQAGLPVLRVGTNFVEEDGLHYLHKGEAVIPQPYNPSANPGVGGGGTARLEALIEKLTAKVEQLEGAARATANNTAGLPQMVDQFDNVTAGGNAMAAEVMA
ncbi:tape measure domain-containing protein [Polaromonas sp. OV174]|uniref:tape measure protein n=1 Tax=Polaromonas sp. OV174 TaxID=1855300 RepID=UPI0008E850F3|nr:tape measure protein [Polaromonas sp. OV174]SFB74024.1 tape measure domain-containing protein [Polaromonas sp. OV174]